MRGLKRFPPKRFLVIKFISPMTSLKTPVSEINRKHRKSLKFTFMISLFALIVTFQIFPKKMQLGTTSDKDDLELIVEDITPRTQQLTHEQPPPRPAVPIPIDNDEIPEDLTIEETELDFDELPPAPPPPSESDEEGYRFIPFDSSPQPIGGLAASLQKYIQYPNIARQAGVEGLVIVGVLIDELGNSLKTTILKDSGSNLGFEAAAQDAVMKIKWIPAKQRDKPVKVWIYVTVRFKLTED